MTIIPIVMALTFWALIQIPANDSSTISSLFEIPPQSGSEDDVQYGAIQTYSAPSHLTLNEKMVLMKVKLIFT